MAARRLKESYELMNFEIFEDKNAEKIPSDHMLVMESLKFCIDTRHDIEDLKIRIIENKSSIDFVISDDPAIYTNRYTSQKLNGDSFGVSSSGLLMILPLAPKFAAICYDGLVYTADLEKGRIVMTNAKDVECINEFQNLKAAENIYFKNWDDRDYVRAQFLVIKEKRPQEWSTVKHLVYDGEDADGERYREGTLAEAKRAGKSLVQMSFKYPQPNQWFSQLKFRSKPKTFYNGTGVGHVRKDEWLKRRERA
jgi:hypothetical protein